MFSFTNSYLICSSLVFCLLLLCYGGLLIRITNRQQYVMFSTTFALICCRHGLIIKKTLVQFYHGTEQDQSTTTQTRKDAEAGLNIAKAK